MENNGIDRPCPQGHKVTGRHCLDCPEENFASCGVQQQKTNEQITKRQANQPKFEPNYDEIAGVRKGRLRVGVED